MPSPKTGSGSPPSGVWSSAGDSPTQHSPPQSTDVRRAQEQQQQQQSEAGGHRRQHPESSPAVWRGGVRLRGEPGSAGTGLQGKRGDRGGGRETRAPAAVAAGGPIPGEEGAAEGQSIASGLQTHGPAKGLRKFSELPRQHLDLILHVYLQN